MKQYKNTLQTIQNMVNASTLITKTPTHYKTHTYIQPHITKPVHNSHNTVIFPQYEVTLMCIVLLSTRTSV
jgi:hypothetical protein